jgi:hypothetical protein
MITSALAARSAGEAAGLPPILAKSSRPRRRGKLPAEPAEPDAADARLRQVCTVDERHERHRKVDALA